MARLVQPPPVQHHVLDELIHLGAALPRQEVRPLQHHAGR